MGILFDCYVFSQEGQEKRSVAVGGNVFRQNHSIFYYLFILLPEIKSFQFHLPGFHITQMKESNFVFCILKFPFFFLFVSFLLFLCRCYPRLP